LQPVIPVIILVDNHFKDDIPIRFLRPHDVRHNVYKKNLNLGLEIYVEINKDISNLPESLKLWMKYFRTGRTPEEAPCYLQEAVKVTKRDSLSKEEQDLADLIEKLEQKRLAEDETVWINATEAAEAKFADEKERLADEIEQKRKKADTEKMKNVKKMIEDNFSLEMIERYTGLSEKNIKQIMMSI